MEEKINNFPVCFSLLSKILRFHVKIIYGRPYINYKPKHSINANSYKKMKQRHECKIIILKWIIVFVVKILSNGQSTINSGFHVI